MRISLLYTGLGIFICVAFLVGTYFMFKMTEVLLSKKQPSFYYTLASIFNVFVGVLLVSFEFIIPLVSFICAFLILCIELRLIFRTSFFLNVFVAEIYTMHLIILYNISESIFSISLKTPLCLLRGNIHLMLGVFSLLIVFLVSGVMIVRKYIPLLILRLIMMRKIQRTLLAGWMHFVLIYLLYSSLSCEIGMVKQTHFASDQIIKNVTILISSYLILYYSFTMFHLLHHEKVNKNLKKKSATQKKYFAALTHNSLFDFEVNVTQNKVIGNGTYNNKKIFDLTRPYMEGITNLVNQCVHKDDVDELTSYLTPDYLNRLYRKQIFEVVHQYRRRIPNSYKWTKMIISLIKDVKTNDVIAYIRTIDIDEKKRAFDLLKQQTKIDLLTSLYNRKATEELIQNQINLGMGVLFLLDIDNFKLLNDTLGHDVGDDYLKKFGQKLRTIFRENDILGRIGGDEFLVCVTDSLTYDMACQKAEAMIKIAQKQFVCNQGNEYCVTVSIGISFIDSSLNFETIYKNTDLAMYEAKKSGKNSYVFFRG